MDSLRYNAETGIQRLIIAVVDFSMFTNV